MSLQLTVKQSMQFQILGRLWMPRCKAALARTVKIGEGPFETHITPDADGAESYVYGSETGGFLEIIDYTAELCTESTVCDPDRRVTTITRQSETIKPWDSEESELEYWDCFPSED